MLCCAILPLYLSYHIRVSPTRPFLPLHRPIASMSYPAISAKSRHDMTRITRRSVWRASASFPRASASCLWRAAFTAGLPIQICFAVTWLLRWLRSPLDFVIVISREPFAGPPLASLDVAAFIAWTLTVLRDGPHFPPPTDKSTTYTSFIFGPSKLLASADLFWTASRWQTLPTLASSGYRGAPPDES